MIIGRASLASPCKDIISQHVAPCYLCQQRRQNGGAGHSQFSFSSRTHEQTCRGNIGPGARGLSAGESEKSKFFIKYLAISQNFSCDLVLNVF